MKLIYKIKINECNIKWNMNRIIDKKIKIMVFKFLLVKDLFCLIGIFVNINFDKDCENS